MPIVPTTSAAAEPNNRSVLRCEVSPGTLTSRDHIPWNCGDAGSSVSSERNWRGGAARIWPSTCCSLSPVIRLNSAAVRAMFDSRPG